MPKDERNLRQKILSEISAEKSHFPLNIGKRRTDEHS